MGRVISFLYGIISYTVFLLSFLYAIGFVGNFIVPKSINSGEETSLIGAILINAILLSLFAVQHSVMARQNFKAWWTKFIPNHIERSTYVIISSLLLFLLYWQWRPLTAVIWDFEYSFIGAILLILFWIGWLIVLLSTFMINHFDLFGLRQVYLNLKNIEYTHLPFTTKFLYNLVRHPIMLGFIIAFWATPLMTLGHFIFAIATTGYIIIALQLEEKDLVDIHGSNYQNYQKQVSMLIPIKKRNSTQVEPVSEEN